MQVPGTVLAGARRIPWTPEERGARVSRGTGSRGAERNVTLMWGARAVASVVLCSAVVLPAGCTSSTHQQPTADASAHPLRLDASVAQFRFDEGTRNLSAGVTNKGDRTIRVSSVTINWDGFAFPTVPIPDPETLPGNTAALTIAYGAARCDHPPREKPTMVAVVDGRTRTLPLRVEDPQLLDRLHAKACAAQALDRAADVSLRWARRPVHVDGELYLPGTLTVTHRPGQPKVTLVDLGGSVLLDLRTRATGLLPISTADPRTGRGIHVLIGSTHRCDAHALGQSSQTFLISAYVRVQGSPTQRVILIPDKVDKARIQSVIDRVCHPGAG